MMLAVGLFISACVFAVLSIGAATAFSVWLRRQATRLDRLCHDQELERHATASPTSRPLYSPEAVVILCVRGHDPYLADTIRALARQDYSNYRVLIVVDHRLDPAWHVVSSIKQELGLNDLQLELQELRLRHAHCGLKCSALVQALESLASDVDADRIIVTIDSDAVPEPTWLANLLQPMADGSVGATTSNQWFEPGTLSLGSWVRAVWQAGAIVPTAMLGNPWAGSCAIRHSDILNSGLMDDWRTSIIDDGPVRENLQRLGKRIEFVPQNLVINREDCSLDFCFRYVARMLTWSRLFESTFWITGVHALVTSALQVSVVLWCLGSLVAVVLVPSVEPLWSRVLLPFTAVTFLLLGQVAGYLIVRQAVMRTSLTGSRLRSQNLARRYAPVSWGTRLFFVMLAVPMATTAYAWGCLKALRVKRVVWRNITYDVENGRQIKMLDYAPYVAQKPTALENHSV